jgi:fluoride ion exporter CrcB/FEX
MPLILLLMHFTVNVVGSLLPQILVDLSSKEQNPSRATTVLTVKFLAFYDTFITTGIDTAPVLCGKNPVHTLPPFLLRSILMLTSS